MVSGYSDLPPSSRQHFAKCKTLEWVPGPGLLRPSHLVCDTQQHLLRKVGAGKWVKETGSLNNRSTDPLHDDLVGA